jgi:hypothetical protein
MPLIWNVDGTTGVRGEGWEQAMSKSAFDKIAEGIKEAIQIARGERKPAKLYVPPERKPE